MPSTNIAPRNPTRFPGGLSINRPTDAMARMGQIDPTAFYTDVEDFSTYTAANWTVTSVGTGSRALVAGAGGLLAVTNSAGIADSNFLQRTVAAFAPVAGKRAFFKVRMKLSDASLTTFQAGLVIQDTTPLDATDGIYFQKASGSAVITAYVRKNATTGSTSVAVGSFVADTFVTLAWHYNAANVVELFVNDAKVGSLDASSTYLPDTPLALSFGVGNGEAVAKVGTFDYIMAAIER